MNEKLKDLRTEKGLSLEEVANAVGITRQALYNYENGRMPRDEIKVKLADYFKTTVQYLFF